MQLRGLLLLVVIGGNGALILRTRHVAATPQQSPAHSAILAFSPLQVDRLDPAANRIIPANAHLEKIATGFTWIEGPVWLNNSLYFADITGNSIRRWTPDGRVSIVLQPSGYKGPGNYNGREPGSNGMTLDLTSRLTVAGHAQRDVYRFDSTTPDRSITILADTYKGKRLNSPNDLVYRADGSLYFTDPPYGLETQKDSDPKKQLSINGVYRIPQAETQKAGAPPARENLQQLITELPRPNGIAFSPDEKYLYVNNSEPKRIWMRYRVQSDGSLADPHLLYDASSDTRKGSPDGMKVDREGNIYSSGPGGLWIFSPEGKPLATISMPETVSNVAWGDADHKTLYITASTSVYRIHLQIPGALMPRVH